MRPEGEAERRRKQKFQFEKTGIEGFVVSYRHQGTSEVNLYINPQRQVGLKRAESSEQLLRKISPAAEEKRRGCLYWKVGGPELDPC